MLDTTEKLKEAGTISLKELMEELQLTREQTSLFIQCGKIFREKYVLVEDDLEFDRDKMKTILRTDKAKYYVSIDGKFYKENNRTEQRKELSVFKKKNIYVVKINNKEQNALRIIARNFIKDFDEKCVVKLKNDSKIKNKFGVHNLKIYSRKDFNHQFCYTKNQSNFGRKKVAAFKDELCIKTFQSVKEAAEYVGYTRGYLSESIKQHRKLEGLEFKFVD